LKHVEDSSKHIIEEIVHQVGYLQELYEDARSEKKLYQCFIGSFASLVMVQASVIGGVVAGLFWLPGQVTITAAP